MVTRPNYLRSVAFGSRPKSRRRRQNALRCVLLPSFIYLILVGVFAIFALLTTESPAHEWEAEPCFTITAFAWFLGMVFCISLPFRLENRFSNADIVQANHHDYRLAGISGRKVLTGLAAPQLLGIRLFVSVYLLTCASGALTMRFIVHESELLFLCLIGAIVSGVAIFNLLVGSFFALAQWALCPNKTTRMLKIAGFIFLSPVAVCTICPPAVVLLVLWVPVEITMLINRSLHADTVWKQALTKLDGNDHSPFIEPLPKVTESEVKQDWRDQQ